LQNAVVLQLLGDYQEIVRNLGQHTIPVVHHIDLSILVGDCDETTKLTNRLVPKDVQHFKTINN